MQEVNSLLFDLSGFSSMHEGGVLERAQALGSEKLVSIPILLRDDVNLLDFSFLIAKVGIMTTEMLLKSPHSAWLLIGSQQMLVSSSNSVRIKSIKI